MVKKGTALICTLFLCLLPLTAHPSAVYEIKIVKRAGKRRHVEPDNTIMYKVKKGDTLYSILRKFHLPYSALKEIVELNKIKTPNLIHAGQYIKLPVSKKKVRVRAKVKKVVKRKPINRRSLIHSVEMFGGKITEMGILFVGNRQINYQRTPKVTIGGRKFIVDFHNEIDAKTRQALKTLGMEVIGAGELKTLVKELIEANFSSLRRNGTIVLGFNDVLVYRYDYMGYNRDSGQLTVVNLKPDTPPSLVNLLRSYGVEVIQPEATGETFGRDGKGKLRILPGGGLEKLGALVYVLTGERGEIDQLGLRFPKSKIYFVYDYVDPEDMVKLELDGYRTAVLSGDFLKDTETLLKMVPVAEKFVSLRLYEPPLSNGARSKFEIKGLLVSTEKGEWLLVDALDRQEEIPYLLERGVNLIIY